MEFGDLLTAVRARWWHPLLGLLAAVGVALGYSLLSTPLYTSTTQLFVSTTDASSNSDVLSGSQFSQQRVTSYARLLTGDEMASRVIDELDLRMTPEELIDHIGATAVTDTVLIEVTVDDPSPERAQRIAQALSSEFIDLAARLERPDATGASPVRVTVTDDPDLPEEPSSPRVVVNIAVGVLLGLLAGVGTALARHQLDRSIRRPEEASAMAGAPVIGTILRDDSLTKGHVIDRSATSRTAEDYRQLRTNLQFLNVDEPPKVIMISSPLPSEGKTTVTINLALALAEAGRRVTIVEADLRRPRVTRYLRMVGGVGLTNILAGTAQFDEVIQPYGSAGVTVIGAGPIPPNPGELLGSSHMASLLDKLRGLNDYVIVDASPLLPVADSTGLATLVDGVLLSVRYGTTRKDQLQHAAAALERVHARTLGVILNIVPPKAEIAGAYGYGYGYSTDAPSRS